MIIEKRIGTVCLFLFSALLLAACENPFDEEAKIEAKRQAEGQAVGNGCRYSSRPLEECYAMNPKVSKAAILAGWRDMDAYMRENNIVVAGPETPDAKKNEPADAKPAAEAEPASAEGTKAVEAPKAGNEPKSADAGPPPVPAAPKRTQGSPQGLDQRKPLKNMV